MLFHYVVYEGPEELRFALLTPREDIAESWRVDIDRADTSKTFSEVRSIEPKFPVRVGQSVVAVICDDDDEVVIYEDMITAEDESENMGLKNPVFKPIIVGKLTYMTRRLEVEA